MKALKGHLGGLKTFRELSPAQMRAAIASTAEHLKDMQRVYKEVKGTRAKTTAKPKHR
jgi:hypothetical protein